VRARVALRVDPLERADGHTLLLRPEVRAEHDRVALNRERREVRLVHDDERVDGKQHEPDDDHHRIAAGSAEDEDPDRGEREERVRGPEERKVGTHCTHVASLGRVSGHVARTCDETREARCA
jgi:hypothetical protein